MEKKKLSLKENSAYEDLAILNELNEIVKQIDAIQSKIKNEQVCETCKKS